MSTAGGWDSCEPNISDPFKFAPILGLLPFTNQGWEKRLLNRDTSDMVGAGDVPREISDVNTTDLEFELVRWE